MVAGCRMHPVGHGLLGMGVGRLVAGVWSLSAYWLLCGCVSVVFVGGLPIEPLNQEVVDSNPARCLAYSNCTFYLSLLETAT